jgi:hypothetical protein
MVKSACTRPWAQSPIPRKEKGQMTHIDITKEDIQIANKYTNKCSAAQIFREMQTKTKSEMSSHHS